MRRISEKLRLFAEQIAIIQLGVNGWFLPCNMCQLFTSLMHHRPLPSDTHLVISVEVEMLKYFWVLIASVELTESRSFGVSNIACYNMTPLHGDNVAADSIAPVQIIPHAIKINRGQQMKVSLRSVESNYTFRGFFLQARGHANQILGNFIVQNGTKVIDCANSYSTVTHADPSLKSTLVLVWKAPSNYRGGFRFQ